MFDFFKVGGAVRDQFLGVHSKDVDFSVVCTDPSLLTSSADRVFVVLKNFLKETGFNVFLSTPEFLTIRAKVPKDHPLRQLTDVADFVLARRESKESDGRRPLWVSPGTLMDDLSRRDFTCNAMALDTEGNLIDPFNGKEDLENKVLRFVGDPLERINEDGLRVLRAFRFFITKELDIKEDTFRILTSRSSIDMVEKNSIDRIRDELNKMFMFDTLKSVQLLSSLPLDLNKAIFRNGLWLTPTNKKNTKKTNKNKK
jgi:tRNA nucleotidyltransferase/poly(A) polymerase